MSLRTITGGVVVALALSACGAGTSPQDLIAQKTVCYPTGYNTPVWSADGTRIYYAAQDSRTGHSTIHSMTGAGGGDRVLVPDGMLPLPSPDGKLLLFGKPAPADPGRTEHSLLDLATEQVRRLGELGSDPAWSPDSQWIAYSPAAGGPIMKINVITGETVALTEPPVEGHAGDNRPLWSPDGTRIAFTSGRDGVPGLYVMNADGTGVTRPGGQDDPGCTAYGGKTVNVPQAWHPDGERLAYTRACDSTSLSVIAADGSGAPGWAYTAESISSAEWSPDPGGTGSGTRILILGMDGRGQTLLNLAAADGAGLETIRSNVTAPHWSPDGTRITFVDFDKAGLQEIYSMAPDGSGLTQLTVNPGSGKVCLY